MKPKIIVVSGPNEGSRRALDRAECGLGSDPANDLILLDDAVSPRHCVIRNSDGDFGLVALDGRRVHVNGIPVARKHLRHGDTLQIGESVLVFLQPELARAEPETLIEPSDFLARNSLELRPAEALKRLSGRAEAALKGGDRLAAELNALLRVSGDLAEVASFDDLGSRLLDLLLEVIPAERSAVLLIRPDEDETLIGQRRGGGSTGRGSLRISRTVVNRVAGEGVSLLCNDVRQSDLSGVESLRIESIRSLLCSPLLEGDQTVGVIYLDTKNPKTAFDENHLLFLTAVAAIASPALRRVRILEELATENRRLRRSTDRFGMVGESEPMQRIFDFIARIAPTDSTVLIRGESGTGKDLAARALHAGSSRSDKPFQALNCAALSETLIESELFGHEKGAFTGAAARRQGKLEAADGGTVFLDEIGELPASIQAKLLRVLETREFERLGGNQAVKVDIRLVAATNRDLEKAIEAGDFRRDLFYRLNVISFEMPPLRSRGRDVTLLARHFLKRLSRRLNRPGLLLSPAAEAVLLHYQWPGNVRELANAMERASVLAQGSEIRLEDLPEAMLETDAEEIGITRYHEVLNRVKRKVILEAVSATGGNITEAAGQLGLHPNYLHRLIRNLGLRDKLSS